MHTAREEKANMVHCLRKIYLESYALTATNHARQKFVSSATNDGANSFYSYKH